MHLHIPGKPQHKPLSELIAVLQAHSADGDFKKAVTELRESADGCPACMFAAIRQSGFNRVIYPHEVDYANDVPVPLISFDFEEERQAFWARVEHATPA